MSEATDCLDVACGDYPQGTCNVDLFVGDTNQRHEGPVHLVLTPNFVRAEACHLPFKTGTFETVRCSHAIEHLDDPVALIREMARVSKHHIVIICPFKYGVNANMSPLSKLHRPSVHKNTFDASWFEQVFKKLGLIRARVSYSAYRHIPNRWLALFVLPEEITAKAQVTRAETAVKVEPTVAPDLFTQVICPELED